MQKIINSSLNPYQYRLNCKTGSTAALFSALAVIALLAGLSAYLASAGIDLGPFNTLGNLNGWTSGTLGVGGGVAFLLTSSWWLAKIKGSYKAPHTISSERPQVKPCIPREKIPTGAFLFSGGELVMCHHQKKEELIAYIHQIDSQKELEELLKQTKPEEFFLRILIRCRIARLTLESQGKHPFNFETDLVIPVCKEGKNRSPAIYATLQLLYPELEVLPPHGAFAGFDPGSRLDWAAQASFYELIDSPDLEFKDQGFLLAYGEFCPHRQGLEAARNLHLPLGEKEWEYYAGVRTSELYAETPTKEHYARANLEVNAQKVKQLKEWMDQNLFRLTEKRPGKRVIFIPLVDDAHREIVKRVEENGNLATITKPIHFNDPFVAPTTTTEFAQAAEKFSTAFLTSFMAGEIFSFDN